MGKQSGEDGIRTRGRVLPLHRFSKPALSAAQPPLQIVGRGFRLRCTPMQPARAATADSLRLPDNSRIVVRQGPGKGILPRYQRSGEGTGPGRPVSGGRPFRRPSSFPFCVRLASFVRRTGPDQAFGRDGDPARSLPLLRLLQFPFVLVGSGRRFWTGGHGMSIHRIRHRPVPTPVRRPVHA